MVCVIADFLTNMYFNFYELNSNKNDVSDVNVSFLWPLRTRSYLIFFRVSLKKSLYIGVLNEKGLTDKWTLNEDDRKVNSLSTHSKRASTAFMNGKRIAQVNAWRKNGTEERFRDCTFKRQEIIYQIYRVNLLVRGSRIYPPICNGRLLKNLICSYLHTKHLVDFVKRNAFIQKRK